MRENSGARVRVAIPDRPVERCQPRVMGMQSSNDCPPSVSERLIPGIPHHSKRADKHVPYNGGNK